jgi:hypothetical protein
MVVSGLVDPFAGGNGKYLPFNISSGYGLTSPFAGCSGLVGNNKATAGASDAYYNVNNVGLTGYYFVATLNTFRYWGFAANNIPGTSNSTCSGGGSGSYLTANLDYMRQDTIAYPGSNYPSAWNANNDSGRTDVDFHNMLINGTMSLIVECV